MEIKDILFLVLFYIQNMENFQELFLASLRDGSYNDGLREKVKVLRDKRHL